MSRRRRLAHSGSSLRPRRSRRSQVTRRRTLVNVSLVSLIRFFRGPDRSWGVLPRVGCAQRAVVISGIPRSVVGCVDCAWCRSSVASLARAAWRLTPRPSFSPSQPLISASSIRSVKLAMISTSRGRWRFDRQHRAADAAVLMSARHTIGAPAGAERNLAKRKVVLELGVLSPAEYKNRTTQTTKAA